MSSLSNRNSQPHADEFPTLPPELMHIIIQLLSHTDQQTFCLSSQFFRRLALPVVFEKLMFSSNVPDQIERFSEVRKDVKAVIKEFVLRDFGYFKVVDYESILFPFLRSLPNLQSFRLGHSRRLSDCSRGFLQLVSSLRHCPLQHFTYRGPRVQEESVNAPPYLKSLSVNVYHAHVYDFVRPSFSTLVELEIYSDSAMFDLLPLRPVGRTLRRFAYRVYGFDPVILGTIPYIFPHLAALKLMVRNPTQDFQWKDPYDNTIGQNTNLQYLAVTANGFTFCDRDPKLAHLDCKKCGKQRLQATRALVMACTGLRQCEWGHGVAQYRFNVRGNSSQANSSLQVKKVSLTEPFMPTPFAYF